MRLLFALTVLTIGANSIAQVLPPINPPPVVPRKVLFDGQGTAVKVLAYSATAQPFVSSPVGSQHTSFGLSLNTTEAPSGYHGPVSYQWSPVRPTNPNLAIPADSLVVDPTGETASAVGRAYAPGVYSVGCAVTYHSDVGNIPLIIQYSGNCAVIGGPIYMGVGGGTIPTWTRDQGLPSGPWYIQYFGYSHWNPPTSTLMQKTQDASAFVQWQPDGTDVYWLLPAPLESPQLGLPFSDPWFINIFAEGESGPVEVRCMFDLTFTGIHGDTATNTGWDDTSTTPVSPGNSIMMNSKITAHKPSEIVSRYANPFTPDYPKGGASCGLNDQLQLKDQLGHLMPGVWVQERFNPTDLAPGMVVNNWQRSWSTVVQPQGGRVAGDFDAFDSIWYVWATAPFTPYSISQQYFGATKYKTIGEPGLFIETWTIGYSPGSATHSK